MDFRKDDPDPWDALIWGVTGERPSSAPRTTAGDAAVLAAWRLVTVSEGDELEVELAPMIAP